MSTRWADVAAQFDHALIDVQLPSREAGTGRPSRLLFSASRALQEHAGTDGPGPRGSAQPESRLRVDMQQGIKTFQGRVLSLSPFEALTAVNEISSRVAQCPA